MLPCGFRGQSPTPGGAKKRYPQAQGTLEAQPPEAAPTGVMLSRPPISTSPGPTPIPVRPQSPAHSPVRDWGVPSSRGQEALPSNFSNRLRSPGLGSLLPGPRSGALSPVLSRDPGGPAPSGLGSGVQAPTQPPPRPPGNQASRPIALSSLKDPLSSQILSVPPHPGHPQLQAPQLPSASCIQHSLTPAEEEEEGARDSWGTPISITPPPKSITEERRGHLDQQPALPRVVLQTASLPFPHLQPHPLPSRPRAQRLGGHSGTLRRGRQPGVRGAGARTPSRSLAGVLIADS